MRLHAKAGFTILELIIFTTILGTFFVMVMQVTISSLSSMKTAEHRTYATRYAEELSEWIAGEKDTDWDNYFLPKAPSVTPTVYCFNSSPPSSWPTSGSCGGYTLNSIYKREVALSRQANVTPGDYQITAVVTVSWTEGSNTLSVPITTIYDKSQ